MSVNDVELALTEAIRQWMEADTEHMQYQHGNAQGIARALSTLRGTSFAVEWEAGLNNYQNFLTGYVPEEVDAPKWDSPSDIARIVCTESPEGREVTFYLDAEGKLMDPEIDWANDEKELKEKYGIDVRITD